MEITSVQDDALNLIRALGHKMTTLADRHDWEHVLSLAKERHRIIERSLAQCAVDQKASLIDSLKHELRGDEALMARFVREREATLDELADLGRAERAHRLYRFG